MKRSEIYGFLKDVASNNNREWMQENRQRYLDVMDMFEQMVGELVLRLSAFDKTVAHVAPKDAIYRFYRDTRFSPDKSPYKRHLGAFINQFGKKSIHCGYYIHLQPGNSFLGGGGLCLSSQVMNAIRRTIEAETDEFLSIVRNPSFVSLYKEIGEQKLKKMPRGFDNAFPYPEYIKVKDYIVWRPVDDDFFVSDKWIDETVESFRIMKPYNDFLNNVIDDYL